MHAWQCPCRDFGCRLYGAYLATSNFASACAWWAYRSFPWVHIRGCEIWLCSWCLPPSRWGSSHRIHNGMWDITFSGWVWNSRAYAAVQLRLEQVWTKDHIDVQKLATCLNGRCLIWMYGRCAWPRTWVLCVPCAGEETSMCLKRHGFFQYIIVIKQIHLQCIVCIRNDTSGSHPHLNYSPAHMCWV